MKPTQKQIAALMAARHPEARFNRRADSWCVPGAGQGWTTTEAEAEALAEIELAQSGVAQYPEWAK